MTQRYRPIDSGDFEPRIRALEEAVSGDGEDTGDIDERLDALEATDTTTDGRLDVLEAQDIALDARLDEVESDVTGLQVSLDAKLDDSQLSIDSTLAANSDALIASQRAIKSYVDNSITGLKWKPSVRCATTANITLSGEQTIDGVLTAVSRVLVKAQTTGSQNGIYVSAAGAWTRATDADLGTELVSAAMYVEQGTLGHDTQWTCTNDTITIGTTAITFAQLSGAGSYSAGLGLSLTGNQFAISDPELVALLNTTSAADKLPYYTGAGTAATTDFLTTGRALAGAATPAAAVATLGFLSTANTWALAQTFSASPIAPTPTVGDSSTKVATTAFVAAAVPAAVSTAVQSWALPLTELGLVPDVLVSQSAALQAAVTTANGRPLTGGGRTYYVANAVTTLNPGMNIHIEDAKFIVLNPTTSTMTKVINWQPSGDYMLRLRRIQVDMGSNLDHWGGGALYLDSSQKGFVDLEDIEIWGNFRGYALLCSRFKSAILRNITIRDMASNWEGDPTVGEPIQGLIVLGNNITIINPQIHRLGTQLHWIAGEVITSTRGGSQYRWYGANAYKSMNAGTTGATPPTHTSGTVAFPDGFSWTYLGPKAASQRYYQTGGIMASEATNLKVFGGHIGQVGEGFDATGATLIENVAFYGTQFEDCDGYGVKFAHTFSHVSLHDVTVKHSALNNYHFAGLAGSQDIQLFNCRSENPGFVTGYGEVWTPGAHNGYHFGGPLQRVKLYDCVAIDDQTTHTMDYAFVDEQLGGDVVLDENCYASGWKTAEFYFIKGRLSPRISLNANLTLYVRPGGNDANSGYNNADGYAFATIQGALNNLYSKYDLNGFAVNISVSAGSYTAPVTIAGPLLGQTTAAQLAISGVPGSPSSVVVVTAGNAFTINGARCKVQNIEVRTSSAGNAFDVSGNGALEFGGIVFGAVTSGRHLSLANGSAAATAVADYEISGNATQHFLVSYGARLQLNGRTVTVGTARAFTTFAQATQGGLVRADGMTFTGAGVAGTTGTRYDVQSNSVLNTASGGAGYFPGSGVGVVSTGGQYL